MATQQSTPLLPLPTPTTQTKQPSLSTPPQKLNLPYSRLRPLSPQSPYRHLRTASSPASTAYSIKNVQSSYPSSGSSIGSGSSTSLSSTGTGSPTGSQPFSTPPSHLPLPHISLPNIQFASPSKRDNEDENKDFGSRDAARPSIPGAQHDSQGQSIRQERRQHIRTPSRTSIQSTTSTGNPNSTIQSKTSISPNSHQQTKNNKETSTKKSSKFNIAVSILFTLHILLVSVLVMALLGSYSFNSQYEGGGYDMVDLREWMDGDGHVDINEFVSLFEPEPREPRERVEIGLEAGDTNEVREKEDGLGEGEKQREYKGIGGEEGEVAGVNGEEEEEEEGMDGTKFTLETVLEELGMGRLREVGL